MKKNKLFKITAAIVLLAPALWIGGHLHLSKSHSFDTHGQNTQVSLHETQLVSPGGVGAANEDKREVDLFAKPDKAFSSGDPLRIGNGSAKWPVVGLKGMGMQKKDDLFSLKLHDREFKAKVFANLITSQNKRIFSVVLEELENSKMILREVDKGYFRGFIKNASGSVAYLIEVPNTLDQMLIERVNVTDLVCGTSHNVGLPNTLALPTYETAASPNANILMAAPTAQTLTLQSRPGANEVIYLDFDGEIVRNTTWNAEFGDIDALESVDNNDLQIRRVYEAVSEDFKSFSVNVTTDRSVYERAAPESRMMVVFTRTSDFYPDAGGVAYLNSFGDESAKVCWVFTSQLSTWDSYSVAASHEVGHTLGLRHDGILPDETLGSYYSGHGTGPESYGPIMGAPFDKYLVTWDRGTYVGANNQQDDFEIITTAIDGGTGFDYINPRIVSEPVRQQLLVDANKRFTLSGEFNFAGLSNPPFNIYSAEDGDEYSFTTTGGAFEATALPSKVNTPYPNDERDYISNIDLSLTLSTQSGQVVLNDSSFGKRDATLKGNLAAGTYVLKVKPTSKPGNLGYATYGQLGSYHIVGEAPVQTRLGINPGSIELVTLLGSDTDPFAMTLSSEDGATHNYTISTNADFFTLDRSAGQVSSGVIDSVTLNFDTSGLPIGLYTAEIFVNSATGLGTEFIVPVRVRVVYPENVDGIAINSFGKASPYPSVINIPSSNGTIQKVTIGIEGFTHTSVEDLRVLLASPRGQSVMLIDGHAPRVKATDLTLQFSKDGVNIPNAMMVNGLFLPTGPKLGSTSMPSPAPLAPYDSDMSVFDGFSAQGDWRLYIADTRTADAGVINRWYLNIETETELLIILSSNLSPGTTQEINFSSSPGQRYQIESSINMTQWQNELDPIEATTIKTKVILPASNLPRKFFRIKPLR